MSLTSDKLEAFMFTENIAKPSKIIPSKPLTYKGINFRSTLEVYWAVFFDKIGIKWSYEPKHYNLGELGNYLPDFYLHNVTYCHKYLDWSYSGAGMWFEVKNPQVCTGIVKSEYKDQPERELDSNSLPYKKLEDLAWLTDRPSTIVWYRPNEMYTLVRYIGKEFGRGKNKFLDRFNTTVFYPVSYEPNCGEVDPDTGEYFHDYEEWIEDATLYTPKRYSVALLENDEQYMFYKCSKCKEIVFTSFRYIPGWKRWGSGKNAEDYYSDGHLKNSKCNCKNSTYLDDMQDSADIYIDPNGAFDLNMESIWVSNEIWNMKGEVLA